MKNLTVYLPRTEIRLLGQQFQVIDAAVRYCYYHEQLETWLASQITSSGNKDFYCSTYNAFYDQIILAWCVIFGSDNEPCHYKKLFKNESIKRKLTVINPEFTYPSSLLQYLLGTEFQEGYKTYHKKTKMYRDQYLIHREHETNRVWDGKIPKPYINIAKKLIREYYFILIKILNQYSKIESRENPHEFNWNIFDSIQSFNKYLDLTLDKILT